MDATLYQIIFGELGDLNCSLIDAFQDTFLENASLSFLSTDGKVALPFFFNVEICFNAAWEKKINRPLFFKFTFPSRFIL